MSRAPRQGIDMNSRFGSDILRPPAEAWLVQKAQDLNGYSFPLTPDDVENPALRRLFEYWLQKREGNPFPQRRNLDPIEMKEWLGRLSLLDVVDGGADFRFRVHGSILAERIGFDMTGRLLSETPHDLRAEAMAQYRETCRRAAPLLVVGGWVLPQPSMAYDRLVLPLWAEGPEVASLLSAVLPAYKKAPPAAEN
jgi:hypothetical protein